MYHKISIESNPETEIDTVNCGCMVNGIWNIPEGSNVILFARIPHGYSFKSASTVTSNGIVGGPAITKLDKRVDGCQLMSFRFVMPPSDVVIKPIYEKEEPAMDPNTPVMKVIDHAPIPDELAQQLSELLTRQTIRERLLMQATNDPTKFKEIEDSMIPITSKIEAIKIKITREHIPPHYQFSRYIWNYDGWEVDGNKIQIIDTAV